MNGLTLPAVVMLLGLVVARVSISLSGRETTFQTILVIVMAVLVIVVGSILQIVCQGLFDAEGVSQGILYGLIADPFNAFHVYGQTIIAGSAPSGTIIALVCLRTELGSSILKTALAAILVLIGVDIYQSFGPTVFNNVFSIWGDLYSLSLPIVCDLLGGSLAGAVIWFLAEVIRARRPLFFQHTGPGAFLFGLGFFCGAVTLGFIVFIRPLPQRASLEVSAFDSLSLAFGSRQITTVNGQPLKEPIPIGGDSYSVSKDIGILPVTVHALPGKQISAQLIELLDCASAKDAFTASAHLTPSIITFPVGDSVLSVQGLQPRLEPAAVSNNSLALLMLNFGSLVQISPASEGQSVVVAVNGPASIDDIPVDGDHSLVFSVIPFQSSQVRPAISLAAGGRPARLALTTPGTCSSVPAMQDGKPSVDQRVWYVVRFNGPGASGSFDLQQARLQLPMEQIFNSLKADSPSVPVRVSSVQVDLGQGQLAIGTDHHDLTAGDNVLMAGDSLEAFHDSHSFRFTGVSNFVLWNNRVLNNSLFEELPEGIQALFITIILGGLGYLLKPIWLRFFSPTVP